jgi:hypothetical protein
MIEIFRRYFRHNHLNFAETGFSSRERVYINENLTKFDQEIHAAALKLRLEHKLSTVSTSRGVVLVRQIKVERPVPVKAVSKLMNLVDDGAKQDEDSN